MQIWILANDLSLNNLAEAAFSDEINIANYHVPGSLYPMIAFQPGSSGSLFVMKSG